MAAKMGKLKDSVKKTIYAGGAALSYLTPIFTGETQKKIAKEVYGDEKKAMGMTETSSSVEMGVGTAVNGIAMFAPEIAAVPPVAVVAATYLLADSAYRLLSKKPKGSLLVEGFEAVRKGALSGYDRLVGNYSSNPLPKGTVT